MTAFIPGLSVMLAFALASMVLAITPGPDMALFVSRTLNYGAPHGFAAMAGALTGIAIHTALAAFGISLLIVAAPAAFLVLKIIGAAYLAWLAFSAIRHGGGLTLVRCSHKSPSLYQDYLTGLAINLTNPKIVLFFVTFLPQFISPADPAAPAKLVFLGVEFIAVSLPVLIGTVLAARWLATTLATSRWVGRALNWSFAAVFATFAAAILTVDGTR